MMIAFYYSLKSGTVMSPAWFFFLRNSLTIVVFEDYIFLYDYMYIYGHTCIQYYTLCMILYKYYTLCIILYKYMHIGMCVYIHAYTYIYPSVWIYIYHQKRTEAIY